MTKFCESCHTANRDRARYCRGCAGKFSGIRTAAHAFAGPITDNEGKAVIAKGQSLTDEQILAMNYLVAGVQGTVAK